MRICIPIREKTVARAIQQVKRANLLLKECLGSYLEIWLDAFSLNDIERILRECKKPVIVVCRGREEKGNFRGTFEEKIEKLKFAVSHGASFVDIGAHTKSAHIKELKRFCRKYRAKLIVSTHYWDLPPELAALEKKVLQSRALGADIVKIAIHVSRWLENITLFELTKRMTAKKIPVIIVGMGEKGMLSRIACPLLGSFLTYAALDKKSATAPGQLTIKDSLLCLSK